MKLPPDIAAAIIAEAGRIYAAQLREDLAGSRLLTLQQAADMLGVSKPTARALAGAVVALKTKPQVLVPVVKLGFGLQDEIC